MSRFVVKYLVPWMYRRQLEAERLAALRARDGDCCARCRRPMRFDLAAGHDQGFRIEPVVTGGRRLDDLRLCHPRCNIAGLDHTDEVTARARKKSEAALFAKPRKTRRKAA
jgi:hypothetical protein